MAVIVAAISVMAVYANVQLKITKVGDYDDISSGGEVLWDYETKEIKFIDQNVLNNRQINVVVYNLDLSVEKEFTITVPQNYTIDYQFKELAFLQGWFSNHFYLHLTKNIFTKTGLIEGILRCTDASNNTCYLFINENSEILAETNEDLDELIDPALTGGAIIFEPGYIVTPITSGINSINEDSKTSLVMPNPTNGAPVVTIRWDYDLIEDGQLSIVDLEGKTVYSQRLKAGSRKVDIPTRRLATGAYIYVVYTLNGTTTTGKVVVN